MGELRPWSENPRTISVERLKNLQRAIAADPDFLRLRPILARKDGVIYCGNQRYLAAVANGATHVPAVVEDVDERTMRERAIRDNEQWGEWSDGLGLVLRSLQGEGSDLGLLGLGDDHIERLLAAVVQSEGGEPEDVDLTPPETATTQVGQLYQLGPHRLICGDSRDPDVWARLLGEERGDCMWTDPPYGVEPKSLTRALVGEDRRRQPAFENNRPHEIAPLLQEVFTQADAHLRPGAPIYVCSAYGPMLLPILLEFQNIWHHAQVLAWIKNAANYLSSGWGQDYKSQHEAILYGWKPGATHVWIGGDDRTAVIDDEPPVAKLKREELVALVRTLRNERNTDVIRIDRTQHNDLHPTMKPVPLVARMLANSTWRGNLVLDPFGGSGSTLVACEQLGRRAAVIELEPRFVDVIVRRWETLTGLRAEPAAAEAAA